MRDEQTKCKKGRHTPRHAFVCRGGINRESSFKSFVEVKKEGDKVYTLSQGEIRTNKTGLRPVLRTGVNNCLASYPMKGQIINDVTQVGEEGLYFNDIGYKDATKYSFWCDRGGSGGQTSLNLRDVNY